MSRISSYKMENHLFNLKLTAKELKRNANKCSNLEQIEKKRAKAAIKKGNIDVARIHAENAIRQRTQTFNYLKMSARVEAVVSRIESALTSGKVTSAMSGVVKTMETALKSTDLGYISKIMDKFEQQFDKLDVTSAYIEDSMKDTVTTISPIQDVNLLLKQIADEAGLELKMELPQAGTSVEISSVDSMKDSDLTRRLAQLRKA